MSAPKGYTRTQIALHWVVFLLVALQFLFHNNIVDAWGSYLRDGTFEPSALVFSHVIGGILILLLVIWRMAIKVKRGAPELPENEPPMLKLAANLTHIGLYLLLLLTALSGAVAWFGSVEAAAQVHGVLRALVLILVLLHIAGAFYQQLVLKSDVMTRMGKPEA
ncbi:cytochrome b [Sinisalibacter aestuarii]|uniref:Cytochrome b n=1 Tax=Sinisalibacter aestuarii TaxID=2949426 RepID=A0ABQ5LV80_9RHOB|nr:cytochrome b/b6 domain-containing protein [Sinisalibacter aestuarii]GKY88883.1 cytochrome b [Sinisalibacter aestuarii]